MQTPRSFNCGTRIWLAALATLLISACNPKPETPLQKIAAEDVAAQTSTDIDTGSATRELFDYGKQALDASIVSATALLQDVERFLQTPSDKTLSEAQEQWRQALLDYRKFNGPAQISIADANTFGEMNRLDYQISAFPIQPGFLDKFGPHKYSGIVHDIGMEISEESLTAQHGLTDLSEAVLGFYPIEFMLFDQAQARDLNDFKKITELSQSLLDLGFETVSEVPNNRRRELLKAQADILVRNISALRDMWYGPEAAVSAAWEENPHTAQLTRKAMSAGLTKIMLEVSDLNRDRSDQQEYSPEVSPSVRAADFAFHQDFIAKALASLMPMTKFYNEEQALALQETLKALQALGETRKLAEEQTEKDHWREMFALIKRASDISAAETKTKNKA